MRTEEMIVDDVIVQFGYNPVKFVSQARTDGWCYYKSGTVIGGVENYLWSIGASRQDGGARFSTDGEAEEYVAARAAAGDKRCIDALAILAALVITGT